MSSEDPIPRDLQEAFKEVVYRYAQSEWTPDGPELLVSIDFKPFGFETVCGFVDNFDDPLPEDFVTSTVGEHSLQRRGPKRRPCN